MSGGVKNMHVSNCTFIGTDVGLRFKSNRGRGGVVENIFISNIGLTCIDANGIKIRNLSLSTKKMPALDFKNSRNVVLDGFKYPADTNLLFHFSGAKTENVKLKNSGVVDPKKQMIVDKDVPANAIKLVE